MAATFAERLEALPDLTDQEKQDYIARNHQMIDEHFVPAYQLLIDKLTALKGTGGNDKGLCYLPEGKRYYEYMVNSSTGTSYPTIEELKSAMGAQMLKDLKAMNALLTKDPSLADQMYSYSFKLTDPNQILEDLKEQCARDYPPIDDCSYTIKQVPKALEGTLSPAFYLTVPLDRPEDNSIYINGGSTNSQKNLYSTLAHEGYPGHMYQTQYFNKHNTCELRKLLSFTSYSEGWATYVEYNSYSLDNGLSPELGQLLQHNSAFTLALYAMLDINIHYEGWDLNKVQEYLEQYFQINDTSIISTIYYDVAENPANYLEYYVGYLEIANMQEMAKNQLGAGFCWIWGLRPSPSSATILRPGWQEAARHRRLPAACPPCSSRQLSIWRPKKPAAVAASFISMSPNLARGSRLRITTEPIASPSQMMGAITWAVIPSGSSSTSGMYALSSRVATLAVLPLIAASSCRLIFF